MFVRSKLSDMLLPLSARCWRIARASRSRPVAAATARCRSAARRTCPRAGRTAATAAAAATSCCVCDDSLRDLQSFRRRAHYRAGRGGHGRGRLRHGADGDALVVRVPPGTQVERCGRARATTSFAPGQRGDRRARRRRRARQQALRDADAPGAALRRAGPAGRGGLARAAAEAARRRRARRAAERRQVVAARAADARRAEGRRLPVHDARAGARARSTPTSASS